MEILDILNDLRKMCLLRILLVGVLGCTTTWADSGGLLPAPAINWDTSNGVNLTLHIPGSSVLLNSEDPVGGNRYRIRYFGVEAGTEYAAVHFGATRTFCCSGRTRRSLVVALPWDRSGLYAGFQLEAGVLMIKYIAGVLVEPFKGDVQFKLGLGFGF